jgi:putative spermidine/putrescine transport system ATP-binding protein
MVFQNYALFPHMTVGENLAFPLNVRKMSRSEIDERIKKALDMVQLGAFADRRPMQLSGGQQQRVAVARALVFDPQLVLMDEPLGALDKQLREQMQLEVKHIHESVGVTVVYVTHDQSEALTMSNRIAVFNDGVIQQLAAPDELYERPLNAFVAQFIGENNMLHGTVKSEKNGICTVDIGNDEVQALKVNVNGVGDRTTLSLRPERVDVNPEPGKYPNEFEGRVQELIYLGDHIRTRASVSGHDDFVVKIANSSEHASLKEGETVRFGWTAEDCRALDVYEGEVA